MDERYEVYCLTDPDFYDTPSQIRSEELDFELARCPVPAGWSRAEAEDWVIYHPDGAELPPQGWKIHVSTCLEEASEVLQKVWDYCRPRRIPFKFLLGRQVLLLANVKYADRSSSGKFITLYPADEQQLETVLTELGRILEGHHGPYILSDLRWGKGPLYVRYGGFAERYCVSSTGEMVPAIETPDGELIPDERVPVFRPPSWVQLPDFLVPHLAARNSTTVADLPYRIEHALHFSNSGGLYLAEDTRDGGKVVLKEARPHAGVDMAGRDAVARLQDERSIMERLSGLDVVPALRDYFTLGEHHFLVQEYIEGEQLYSSIVDRSPVVTSTIDPKRAAEYTAWALEMDERVERAVAALHERGVVFGDMHPSNILVRPDNRVVLIDFEGASDIGEQRKQALADPAFAAPRDRSGVDVDRYALACLRLFLFLPLTTLLHRDPSKCVQLADAIAELFPVPRAFLDEAVQVILGETGTAKPNGKARHDERSWLQPTSESWIRTRDSMARAILASATPQRKDRLFPGDIEQFVTGGLNLAHGAAGVLYALARTGAGRHPEHEEWLLHRAANPEPGVHLGFYDGLHGVAHVLDALGHRAEAVKLLDLCSNELSEGRWERLGPDLYGGLAGIGLNLLHFSDVLDDPSLREEAQQIGEFVADELGDVDDVPEVSGGRHPSAGLMRGSSGPALLFVRLHEATGDPAWLDAAAVALGQDLRRCVRTEEGTLEVNEDWRSMPYLAEGSAGIGMVLAEYLAHREDERFAEATAAIRLAAVSQFYVEPCLFHGRAGLMLLLCQPYPPGTAAARDPQVAQHVRRLVWHAMDYQGHLAFPGAQLMRLSMDLATGTAGVLLALGAALHPEPVHLPFLGPLRARRGTDSIPSMEGR